MKKVAALLIVLGSGLAAYGMSGFGGSLATQHEILPGLQDGLSGSLGWSDNERAEIVIGVVALAGGLILRKDSK